MSNPLILVIDDDLGIVQMITMALQEEGYTVISGYDGQMALNLARTRKPRLIVMDVNMPMTSGLKALEFLRLSPETAQIPVLFLSGEKSGSIYPLIETAQRVSFIKKPVDIESLLSTVKQILSQYGPQ